MIGALCIKHMMGVSDVEVTIMMQENPYLQYFCELDQFTTKKILDESSLTNLRKRIGIKFFKELEKNIIEELKKKKIIRSRGMIIDAIVFPADIKYSTDTGLLNDAREWLVKTIDGMSKKVGKQVRTYKRIARKIYFNLSKKKNKKIKEIRKGKKQLLQFVKRNISQLKEIIEEISKKGNKVGEEVRNKIAIIEKIYKQQREMYKEKKKQIKERIVSLY